jgi:hypothetical protein
MAPPLLERMVRKVYGHKEERNDENIIKNNSLLLVHVC